MKYIIYVYIYILNILKFAYKVCIHIYVCICAGQRGKRERKKEREREREMDRQGDKQIDYMRGNIFFLFFSFLSLPLFFVCNAGSPLHTSLFSGSCCSLQTSLPVPSVV